MTTYKNRYQAEKLRVKGRERVIKVEGGYAVLSYHDYAMFKRQK